jgi:riboflavin synthase
VFSGIIKAVGRVAAARARGDGLRLRIDVSDFGMDEVELGDSIAIQGVCHTVVDRDLRGFEVDTSRATLDVTTGLAEGREVNLEKSMRLSDRIDGHLVSGHVDGVGRVIAFDDLGGSYRLEIEAPEGLAKYLARKGSVAVDGVSLTVNAVTGNRFEVNIIPHTRAVTTLRNLAAGSSVNLEVDMLARYVERMLGR